MTPDPALLIQPCSQWTSVWICFLPEKSAHFLHHKESSIISQFPLCLTCQLFESLSIASLYWKWALMGYMGYCWYLSWGSVHKLIWEHGRNKVQNKQTCKQIKCVCVCVHTHTRAHIFVCIYICVRMCVYMERTLYSKCLFITYRGYVKMILLDCIHNKANKLLIFFLRAGF